MTVFKFTAPFFAEMCCLENITLRNYPRFLSDIVFFSARKKNFGRINYNRIKKKIISTIESDSDDPVHSSWTGWVAADPPGGIPLP